MIDGKVWRGVRYAIIPSLALWALIIWALPPSITPITILTLNVTDGCEHETVKETDTHVYMCWHGDYITYEKMEVIYAE